MVSFYYVAGCGRSSWVSRRAAALSPVRAQGRTTLGSAVIACAPAVVTL
jgi:hypothetical protein